MMLAVPSRLVSSWVRPLMVPLLSLLLRRWLVAVALNCGRFVLVVLASFA